MTETLQPLPHERIVIDDAIVLQATTENDASKLFEITDTNREYLAKFLPWLDDVKTEQDSLLFARKMQRARTLGSEYGYGMRFHGELVGHISLMHVNDGQIPEIGYWIAQSASGNGITTKAARALTEFGFTTLGVDTILIRARIDNVASNAIAEKLGYVFNGVQKDASGELLNHWIKTSRKL